MKHIDRDILARKLKVIATALKDGESLIIMLRQNCNREWVVNAVSHPNEYSMEIRGDSDCDVLADNLIARVIKVYTESN